MNFELKDIHLWLCTKVQRAEQKAARVEAKKQRIPPTQPRACQLFFFFFICGLLKFNPGFGPQSQMWDKVGLKGQDQHS